MKPLGKFYTAVAISAALALGYQAIKPSDDHYVGPSHSIANSINGAVEAAADTNCDGFVDDEELAAFHSLPERERVGRTIAGRSRTIIDHLAEQNQ